MNLLTSRSFLSVAKFNIGLDIQFSENTLDLRYGEGVFGPRLEYRSLDSIRQGLQDPNCTGPDPVYAIAMDVGRVADREELKTRMLLFGIVLYAGGRLGAEPVRSQGHVHKIAPHCGWSTPELMEIWKGRAVIYLQEKSRDNPGRCIGIEAGPGDRVVVPPGWAHYVVNADVKSFLIMGAWCDREYGFDYAEMRAHHGLAWFPLVADDGQLCWEANPNYLPSKLECRNTRRYPELDISPEFSLYEHLYRKPESIQWVSNPATRQDLWERFEP